MSQNAPTGEPTPLTGQEITGGTGQPAPPIVVPPTVTPPPPPTGSGEQVQAHVKPASKIFGQAHMKRVVDVAVMLPAHYGDEFEPWRFDFRVALSSTMQKQREEWLGLPAKQADEKSEAHMLDELCDLLVRDPLNIGDFPEGQMAPGDKLRAFFMGITDPDFKALVWAMLRAANNLYWNRVSPREFRS